MSTCRVKCVSTLASVSGRGYMCPHCHWKYGPVIYETKGPAHDGFALKTKKDLLLGRQRPCPAGRHKIPVRQIAGTPSWIWCAFVRQFESWDVKEKMELHAGDDRRYVWPACNRASKCDSSVVSLSPLVHYVMVSCSSAVNCCSACCGSKYPYPDLLQIRIRYKIWNTCMISDTHH